MKIKISLNGVTVEKQIPLSWSEVSFGQFLELSKVGNDFAGILSVFTGIDTETLKKAKINNLDSVRELLSFIENEQLDGTLPESILGYQIPKNLELETIAQYEDIKLYAAEIKDKGIELYANICAVYACNPYDNKKAEELAKEFLNAPCSEVVAVGNFTLQKLIGLRINGLKSTRKLSLLPKSWRLAIKNWLIRLVFTVRFYLWKRRLRSIATNS